MPLGVRGISTPWHRLPQRHLARDRILNFPLHDLPFSKYSRQRQPARVAGSAADDAVSGAMIFTVAIDGPAAAGKGTISRAVAMRFGFRHLDTGLLYRAVGAIKGDPVAAARSLTPEDLGRGDLRTLEAGQAASRVAALPEVRTALIAFQRRFARSAGGAVLDGRDIGSVICPEAEVKLYVTASAEVRAHRRWLEVGGDEARVLAEVLERDARDMGRADAPLKAAKDAVVIDTSTMGIAEAVEAACAVVAQRIADKA
jgi:CMP/dCMP kinase